MSFWTEFRDVIKIVGAAVIAYYSGNYSYLLAAVSDVYGRDQRRKAARRARQAFEAGLKDRYQMVRGGTEPRKILYGRARISGPIAFGHSSGTKKEFLHLVVALVGHECDAIETVLFNDTALPAEDGSGFITSGDYSNAVVTTVTDSFSGTSKTLPFTPTSIVLVSRESGSGDLVSSTILTSPADYTLAGATLTIPGGGVGTITYTYTTATPRVRIKKFLGTATQAASTELVSESGGKWTSAHQLKGICYLYVRLEYDTQVFGQTGLPNISAIPRGKKVYDPRLDSTAGGSGAHRIATPSTWAWSENAALCTADYLRDAIYGLVATAAQTPAAESIIAANVSDEAVLIYNVGTVLVTNGSANVTGTGTSWLARARPGMLFVSFDLATYVVQSVTDNTHLVLTTNYAGTTTPSAGYTLSERRYTANGVLDSADAARNNLDKLVECMAGTVVWTQGRWLIRAGAHIAPTITITEDWLGDKAPQINPRAPRQELFNRVLPTYAEREKLYTETQAPPVTNATYVSDDGGLDLPTERTYDLCTGGVRAQRLAKIDLERSRQALTVRLSCNLRAYDLSPSDVVALTLARYGWSAKQFEVLQRTLDPSTWQVELLLRETASGVWDWALGAETAIDLTPNTNLPNPFTAPATLTGMSVASGTAQLLKLGDGSIITRALVSWVASTDIYTQSGGRIEIRWKLDNATEWVSAPSVPGDSTSTLIGPLDDLRVNTVQIRPVNSRGRFGAWTTINHVVVGKSAAPANVASLAYTIVQGGARITWADNTEVDYESTELRFGASWAAGTRLFRGNASSYTWANPAQTSAVLWAKHFDTTGNESATANSLNVLIGPPAAEGGFVNSDPALVRPAEWVINSYTGAVPLHQTGFSATPGVLTAWYKSDGAQADIWSAKFAVSSLKTYLVESMLYMLGVNTTTHYLGIAFYDTNGTLLTGTLNPMTGWPGLGTFHYFGLVGTASPNGPFDYVFSFGAKGTATIPPLATHARVILLGSYSGSGVAWGWGGARVREIVDTSTIAPGAVDQLAEISVASISITGQSGAPGTWTTIGTLAFTAAGTGDVEVSVSGQAFHSGVPTVAADRAYCSLALHADFDNSGAPHTLTDERMFDAFDTVPAPGGVSITAMQNIQGTKRRSVVKGTAYSWPLYGQKTEPISLTVTNLVFRIVNIMR